VGALRHDEDRPAGLARGLGRYPPDLASRSLEGSQALPERTGFVAVWVIVGCVAAALVLYAADRTVKARAHLRRLRAMSDRLAAATSRADEQQEQRQAADQAGAALTSVMPAINHPSGRRSDK
jgi:hypothetical protein